MSVEYLPGSVVQRPSHAYIPGQNDRHSEDAFDTIRSTAVKGLDSNQLAHCDAFIVGLEFLHAGYYWEAHEVLEPVWMVLPDESVERRLLQGLIQLANGQLKLRMGRHKAAIRLVILARELVPVATSTSTVLMNLGLQDVHDWIDALELAISFG